MKLFMKYLLALILVLPLLITTSEAQNKIAKQVIAGGGTLNQTNSNGVTISGMLGQAVIFKQAATSPLMNDKSFDLYQGFWVPEPAKGVGVDDDQLSWNDGISNYPNPVTSSTTIKYDLKSPSYVALKMYDMAGNQVATIFEGYQTSGEQSVLFDTKDRSGMPLASGSYVYELNVSPSDMAGMNAFSPYMLRNVMIIVR